MYHTYVRSCLAHGIKQLNSASFGKLVHIIFPDLKTRRLGVRGESKYHYVELALVEDDGMIGGFNEFNNAAQMRNPARLHSVGAQTSR